MQTSTVAPVRLPSILNSIYILLVSAFLISAQSVKGTNSTLPDLETKSAFLLRLDDGSLFDEESYIIVPLTVAAGEGQSAIAISTYNIQGNFKYGNLTDNLNNSDMAFICCDSTPLGNASEMVAMAAAQNPQAIVLFSLDSNACSRSGDYGYQSIYSMTTRKSSQDLLSTVALRAPLSPLKAIITPSSKKNIGTSVIDANSEGGPVPTTAVAMSILYSITGVITLLFLIIIATGAVRAHRHPERYGPRNNAFPGRPRQSRAKGLARAILDTLPIIQYEDPTSMKDGNNPKYIVDPLNTNLNNLHRTENDLEKGDNEVVGPISKRSVETGHDNFEGDLGCSICTEDFIAGEDLRVLPCNHKYHPVCIDPWLLHVCGTCPLCRHDLRPVTSNTSGTGNILDGHPPPPLSAIEENIHTPGHHSLNSRRNRITRFLDLNRLRQAQPAESISALRQLRQQTHTEAQINRIETPEESTRSLWLTNRLKDVFRVKTRTQSAETSLAV
ncbi:putative ring finger domain protein [Golovinomyces cichoracearum]|uniref:RING-type E3 ubiquitin transferase n=1 Tax=Golovinomyces cichoracearum TaxID=62708 RepID=A0A420ITH2_9PEZI|nr:putative ring finger domain protein [Golovinomyces cichoracearum]